MTDAISAAESGLTLAGRWMDTTALNIANGFTPARAGAGNPVGGPVGAGARGAPGYSNVDLSVEMPNLLMAADDYEANLAVLARAQSAYQSVIDLAQPRPERI